jgi:hypothetical protein
MARYLPLAFLLLFLAGCAEPFIVFSGNALTGTLALPPADWTALNEVDVVQFETRPADPYSINIWAAGIGSSIYVATSEGGTTWSEHLAVSRDVRLRINDAIYELEAFPVTDPQERTVVAAEYVRKYDVDEDDNWVTDGQLFRLDRR